MLYCNFLYSRHQDTRTTCNRQALAQVSPLGRRNRSQYLQLSCLSANRRLSLPTLHLRYSMSTELPQVQNAAVVLEWFKPSKPPPRVPVWDGQQHTLVRTQRMQRELAAPQTLPITSAARYCSPPPKLTCDSSLHLRFLDAGLPL